MRGSLRPLGRLAPAILIGWALASLPAAASQVRSLNLEELASRAGTIVSGRCAESREIADPQLRLTVREVRIEVDGWAKGPGGNLLELRSPVLPGTAEAVPCEPGEEVVLFLYAPGPLGLTSPVGLGQGRFRVVRDKAGRKLAINDTANSTLLRGLSEPARGRLGSLVEGWKPGEAIDVEALFRAASRLGQATNP